MSDVKEVKSELSLPNIYFLWMIFCIHSWAKKKFSFFTVFLGFRLAASSRNAANIHVAAEIIFINALNFKSSFRVWRSLVTFLNPSRLNVANWTGQMGVCELAHMCAAKNGHVVRNERMSGMRALISNQKALNGEQGQKL